MRVWAGAATQTSVENFREGVGTGVRGYRDVSEIWDWEKTHRQLSVAFKEMASVDWKLKPNCTSLLYVTAGTESIFL